MNYRTCAACGEDEPANKFSNNQWRKGTGISRCEQCVEYENFPDNDYFSDSESPNDEDTTSYRVCADCHDNYDFSDFSSNQWRKGEGESRCFNCVRNNVRPFHIECAACGENLHYDNYSNNQWSKGQGVARCTDCVQQSATPPRQASPSNVQYKGRACAACEMHLNSNDFSSNQWVQGVGISRCFDCVREGHVTLSEARGAARNNNATSASFAHYPFEHGAFRDVHKGTYTKGQRKGQQCVVKFFRGQSIFESSYFEHDLAVVEKAVDLVTQWNQMNIITKKITINKPEVWVVNGGETDGQKNLTEPFIDNWTKFNSNSGWMAHGNLPWSEVMQALSHFSYHVSGGQFVLCDIQGGVHSKGAVLTDPVVLSRTRKFGPTDLGSDGISNFFGHHKCGQYCSRSWSTPKAARATMAAREGTTMDSVPSLAGAPPRTARARWQPTLGTIN